MAPYDYLFKLVIIGESSTGKTAILTRFVDEVFESDYICTVGVDFKMKTIRVDDKAIKLQIWDTAGQERFRPIVSCYYRGAHGCILCYDVTNRCSFERIESWLDQYRDITTPKNTIILVGNKKDQESDREVTVAEAKELADKLNASFFETSAKNNEGISEVFIEAAKLVYREFTENEGILQRKSMEESFKSYKVQPKETIVVQNNTTKSMTLKEKRSNCKC